MSQKNPEHIINYILRKTIIDSKTEVWKRYKKKKIKSTVDNNIYFCNNCKKLWSQVPKYIDFKRWRYFPKGNLPTLGKKRKKCPNCDKRGGVNEKTSKHKKNNFRELLF